MSLKYEVIVCYDYRLRKLHNHKRHGLSHRCDFAATVASSGSMVWYQYGNVHRTDGPAVIHRIGRKSQASYYFYNGKGYDFISFKIMLIINKIRRWLSR